MGLLLLALAAPMALAQSDASIASEVTILTSSCLDMLDQVYDSYRLAVEPYTADGCNTTCLENCLQVVQDGINAKYSQDCPSQTELTYCFNVSKGCGAGACGARGQDISGSPACSWPAGSEDCMARLRGDGVRRDPSGSNRCQQAHQCLWNLFHTQYACAHEPTPATPVTLPHCSDSQRPGHSTQPCVACLPSRM